MEWREERGNEDEEEDAVRRTRRRSANIIAKNSDGQGALSWRGRVQRAALF